MSDWLIPTGPPIPPGITSRSASEQKAIFLAKYCQLLVNRQSPIMVWRDDVERYAARDWSLTPAMLARALNGEMVLGLYSVSVVGTCRWVCLDFDAVDDVVLERLFGLVDDLVAVDEDRHVLLEESRRGYHLWTFFDPPVPWTEAKRYGDNILERYELQAEVYPKGPGFTGVRAPLSVHPKTGLVYPLINLLTGLPESDPTQALMLVLPKTLEIPIPVVPETLYHAPQGLSNVALPPATTFGTHEELLALASQFTTLKRYGHEKYLGRCPLHHPDRHPSFGITGSYWKCFAHCQGAGRSHGGVNALKARLREKGLLA